MHAQWTADIIGEMHLHGITGKCLAEEVGWNPKYLSAVLNGHRESKKAKDVLGEALGRIIENRKTKED